MDNISKLIETKNNTDSLVEEISTNLSRISTDSEQGFLDLGSGLQQATREGQVVDEKIRMILDLAESDLGQGVLRKIMGLTESSSNYFKSKRTAISENSAMLNTLTGHLNDLKSKNSQVEQMAKYLRAVALNIFIETSRTKSLSDSFSIIAEEIKELSEHILTLAKHVRENVGDSESRLHAMDKEIRQGIGHLEQLTAEAGKSFEGAIDQTQDWLMKAKELAEKNIEVHKNIQNNVGHVVMSLQFQDAMRQRLEHIVENLADMKALLDDVDVGDEAASENTLAVVYAFSALLSDQVSAIIQEANEIYGSCLDAFETIQTQMVDIGDEVKAMMTGVPRGAEGAVKKGKSKSRLIESLQEFLAVKNEGDDLANRMKDIYDMASETSSTLKEQVGQIHQISMDAHIKALNAIIAAIHLGHEGKTLSVLAGEMKSLSDLTDTFVKEINDILVALVEGSRIEDQSLNGEDDYGTNLEEMVNTVPQLISDQVGHFRSLRGAMKTVGVTHDTIRSQVTFIPDVARELEAQKEVLDRLKTLLEPYRKEGAEASDINAMIKERYTMEREREIHRQSLEAEGDTASPDPGVESEFEDNIELF